MMRTGLKLVILAICAAVISCSPEHDGESDLPSLVLNPNPDPQLAAAAANVLGPKCISCHGSSGSDQRFLKTLADPGLDELAVNTRYVNPGLGDLSLLVQRVVDLSMPPGSPLNSGEIQTIKDWIDDLATVNETGPSAATFTQVETQILAPKCYTCHSSGSGGITFSDYNSVRNTIVTPGTLDSALYQSTARVTNPMPTGGAPLTQNELALIESWIVNGALND